MRVKVHDSMGQNRLWMQPPGAGLHVLSTSSHSSVVSSVHMLTISATRSLHEQQGRPLMSSCDTNIAWIVFPTLMSKQSHWCSPQAALHSNLVCLFNTSG